MKAALLLYQKFVGDLITIGFKLNPDDPCVANKIINGKQLTLVWHVDDIKASHVEEKVVTRMEKCFLQPFCHMCDHLFFNVARFNVVNVPYYGKLLPVDDLFFDAGAIGVQLKPNRC